LAETQEHDLPGCIPAILGQDLDDILLAYHDDFREAVVKLHLPCRRIELNVITIVKPPQVKGQRRWRLQGYASRFGQRQLLSKVCEGG